MFRRSATSAFSEKFTGGQAGAVGVCSETAKLLVNGLTPRARRVKGCRQTPADMLCRVITTSTEL